MGFSQQDTAQLVSAFRNGDANGFVQSLAKVLDVQFETPQDAVAAAVANRPGQTQAVRSLDTDFVISTTRDAQVAYTVEMTASLSILGTHTDASSVQLLVNGLAIASTVKNLLTATLTLGVAITATQQSVLSGFVPAGSTVCLSSIGTATLVSASEVLV